MTETKDLYDTLPILKESYKKLKWLQQFNAKISTKRVKLMLTYIVGASLVAGDGFTLARIDIPNELKDYCEGKETIEIVKVVANPHVIIVRSVSDKTVDPYFPKRIREIIDSTKDTISEGTRLTSFKRDYIKRISTMPGYAGKLSIYVKDQSQGIVIVSDDAMSIIMPMHHGDHIQHKTETKSEEKEKENE